MKTKYHYFYKITNLLNGYYYYGVHNTNNLEDGYMGSGKKLQLAFKEFGIENFNKEILKFFNTDKEAFLYESKIVTEELINDETCYNLNNGGNGGWNYINNNLVIIKDINNNIFCVDKNDPRYLSGELISIHKNKVNVKDNNGNTFCINKNDSRYLSGELVGVTKGYITVKDKNNNFFYVSKDDPRYLSGELKFIWTNKHHSKETIEKMKFTKKKNKSQSGEKNSQYGTCWIYNLDKKECIKIKKEELYNYIKLGYIKGRKLKF